MQKHVKERHFVNLPKHSKMDFGYNKKSASAEGISAETDFFVSGVLNFSFYVAFFYFSTDTNISVSPIAAV
mgnify:FL=1